MAGLELVVRPVVFPNIRPAQARMLAPESNPDQGIAVISGTGGKLIDLTHSWSASHTETKQQQETKRQYDVEKVYQVNDDGTINRDNFIEVERLKKVKLDDGGAQGPIRVIYAEPPPANNIEVKFTDMLR
jgi:hypothetical protein